MVNVASSGQITITDLNDAPVLFAVINSSMPTTQIYNQSDATYTPTYATSPYQVFTASVTKAGSDTELVDDATANLKWEKREGTGAWTEVTATASATNTSWKSGTKQKTLTRNHNVPVDTNGTVAYRMSGTWTDPNTSIPVPFSAEIELNALQLTRSPLVAHVYAQNGDTFRNAAATATLVVNADLYKNGAVSAGAKQIKFFAADTSVTATTSTGYDADGGLGWYLCTKTSAGRIASQDPTAVNVTAQGTLTVSNSMVPNALAIKVVIIDKTGGIDGNKAMGTIVLRDLDDPILTVIQSTAGTVIKNGISTTTTLTAKLYRAGEEIDTAGTEYTYTWTRRKSDGTQENFKSAPTTASRTGKSIAITNTDIVGTATFTCEVSK